MLKLSIWYLIPIILSTNEIKEKINFDKKNMQKEKKEGKYPIKRKMNCNDENYIYKFFEYRQYKQQRWEKEGENWSVTNLNRFIKWIFMSMSKSILFIVRVERKKKWIMEKGKWFTYAFGFISLVRVFLFF